MFKFVSILLLLFISSITLLNAQDVSIGTDPNLINIKDEFYNNVNFSEVLKDLASKYPIKFKYDANIVSKYNLTYWFVDTKLSEGLKKAFKGTELKYMIDGEFVIHVAPKNQVFDKTIELNYKGESTRYNFNISGKIIDVITGETLPFATISVKNTTIGSQTNVDGLFTLLKVPSDTSVLEVSYIGYQTRRIYLNPKLNFTDFIIELEPASQTLNEITVTADKTEVMKANEIVGMIKMTPKNLSKLPNIGERDPFRAFQLMPGVSASNESSSGLYVRGGTPDQTLVLYDGFTVYHVDHLFGFFSAFNYNALKDIQLYKGGFDAKFGGRISGVAEIIGKEGNKKEFNAGGDLSLLSANAYLESPIGKKGSFLIAGRRSYKGPLYNKIFNRFTDQANSQAAANPLAGSRLSSFQNNVTASSYFYDINSKLTFRPTKKDVVSLSIYNGTDDMDNSTSSSFGGGGASGGPFGGLASGLSGLNTSSIDVSKWGNTGGSLKWSKQWNEKLYSNSLLSYSNYFSNRDNTRKINLPAENNTTREIKLGQLETNDLNDVTFKTDLEYKLTSNNQIEFGAQITSNQVKYQYSQNDTISVLDRNDKGTIASVYIQDKLKIINNRLEIKPGLRITNFDVTAKNYFEPRLSANYAVSSKFKLKAAAGVYYQIVKQINREDITAGNRNFWILSNNANLPVTKSNHLIVGGSYETKDYLLDLEFYQKQNTNITEYTLRFVRQVGVGITSDETFFNGNETIKGLDVLFQKKFGKFNGWLGYTISEAKRNIVQFSDKPYFSDQDVRHQFKVVGSYKYKSVDFAATLIYSSGRPYTSIIGAYSVDLLDNSSKNFTNPSDKNANRLPAYHRLDLSATYNHSEKFNIGFSVFNAYNRTNTWYKKYEVINENGLSYLNATNVNYLGFTPNVTLSYKLK